jgi:hypothetical protein
MLQMARGTVDVNVTPDKRTVRGRGCGYLVTVEVKGLLRALLPGLWATQLLLQKEEALLEALRACLVELFEPFAGQFPTNGSLGQLSVLG